MPLLDLVFGLGIFLFGMAQLERAVEMAGGDLLRRWLGQTATPLRSITSGVVVTTVVQSSSLVSLLVLAFAAAGTVPLFNAIGVMCGAALGTTTTGWLVTLIGFKLDLQALAVPLLGAGALAVVFSDREQSLHSLGWTAVSIGLLLFGLGLMKSAADGLPALFDASLTRTPPLPLFFVIGLLVTALIQSSSAMMLLALTALHGGLIDLPQGALIMAGANLGTTSTTLLAAMKGAAVKKRLALASLVYHLFTSAVAIALLPALIWWLAQRPTPPDPLFALAGFHSAFNLIGLLLFWPLLRRFSGWLEHRFREGERSRVAPWLSPAAARVPAAAIAAAERAVRDMIGRTLTLNARNLHLSPLTLSSAQAEALEHSSGAAQSFEQRYEQLKRLEGELLRFVREAQREKLSEGEADALMRLAAAARDTVLSAKNLKDIRANLATLRHSDDATIDSIVAAQRDYLQRAYTQLARLLLEEHDRDYAAEQLTQLQHDNERLHQKTHETLYYSDQGALAEEGVMLSTLLNVNRELWHGTDNLIQALRRLYAID
jgi:phosphate:Na+ symporter